MRKFWVSLVVLPLASCLAGCEEDVESASGGGTIAGRLVSDQLPDATTLSVADGLADSELPVSAAVCTVEGTDKRAATSDQGNFEINEVSAGTHILVCSRVYSGELTLAALAVVDVRAGQTTLVGTLRAEMAGAIAGNATALNAASQEGLRVTAVGTSFSATTSDDGDYLLEGLPAGTYNVRFERPGYLPMTLADVTVTANATTTLAPLVLAVSTGVEGAIVIEAGEDLVLSRGVEVTLYVSAGATIYMLSEDPTFVGASWQPLEIHVPWQFDSDGRKILYARFADESGLESAPVEAAVIVDTESPVLEELSYTYGTEGQLAATIQVMANDSGAGVVQLITSMEADFSTFQTLAVGDGAPPFEFPWLASNGLPGNTIYVKAVDGAGRESTPAQVTPAPTIPMVWNAGVQITNRFSAALFFALPADTWVGYRDYRDETGTNHLAAEVVDVGSSTTVTPAQKLCDYQGTIVWEAIPGFSPRERVKATKTYTNSSCGQEPGLVQVYLISQTTADWSYGSGQTFLRWNRGMSDDEQPDFDLMIGGTKVENSVCLEADRDGLGYCPFIQPDAEL